MKYWATKSGNVVEELSRCKHFGIRYILARRLSDGLLFPTVRIGELRAATAIEIELATRKP